MKRQKGPLYRKYNKLARGFFHTSKGGEFKHQRHSKALESFEGAHLAIGNTRQGYDYTPLFKFLLSCVGRNWNEVFSEAVHRLDKQEPIFWLVDLHFQQGRHGVVCIRENSYYSTLTVKDEVLVLADPNASAPERSCTCCTHSFNGVPY